MKKFELGKNKRNINNANNLENSKSKKKISKDLKEKFSNLEIKPQFLIIGLVAIITVISLIYFIFLKYSPIMNFKYEGYAIKGKEITENLLGASKNSEESDTQNDGENNQNIGLAKIEEQGTIFKKLGTYFIGNKEKTEIDLNYPIYINDKNTIYNLSKEIMLISKDFEQVSGYPNISITDGKVYNGNSLERADSKEYIFAKTEEEIYINLKEIKINTTANEYTIPANSLIAFEENEIKYYSLADNILLFNKINDIDYNSQVTIKNIEDNAINNLNIQKVDKTYNYEELLTRLEIKENAKNDVENSQEEIIKEDTTENPKETNIENETIPSENKQEEPQPENDEGGSQENKYIKPEVAVDNFTAEVYSAKSTLTIKDQEKRILEAPTFEIYKEGKIYLRRIFNTSGEIQITGLVPDTEYEIIGKYIYLNEENKKIENTFYKGKIKTKGYESLGAITLEKEEGEIYSNKIQIKNLKITSNINAEAVKGINQVEIETGEIKTILKNNQVNELLQGKEITIESSEGLKSNSKVDYKIKFYDKKGKELKVENNEGKTKTSKQKPSARVAIKEQDIVSVTLEVKLTNRDKVKLENYKYVVAKPNGEKIKEERLSENENKIKLEDLDQNQYYKITIYADFDLNDNKGSKGKVEIGNLVFATKPISTLGSLELKVENKETTNKSAKISYKIDEENTDKRLIQILNELTIKIVNEEENTSESERNRNIENTIYTHTLTGEEIKKLQLGETKEINYEQLKSNTTYKIEITGKSELGNTKEEIPITYTYNEFTTLKIPAKIEIKNQFVTGNLIDLDVRIEDTDNSVLNEKVRMELRDEKNNLIDLQEIETNKNYVRKTYEKLEENKKYKLSFYADQYNEGSTDETYKVNYLIKELEIVTEPGISGSIGLTELTRKETGKNLVDVSSDIKWYVYPNFNTGDYYGKEYDDETKILILGGHGNYRKAVYDLREYAGKEVTMSFKAKAVSGTQNAYIQNSKKDANRTQLKDLTEEWKDYKYTLKVDSTGYLGFYIAGGNGIEVKELQIELGNKKTSYEEYKYTLQSKYSVNLEDKRDEITTNDYYIKVYEDNNLVKTDRYEEIPEENNIKNAIKTYEVQKGKSYKVELAVKIKEREYILSELEYNTKEAEEIRGIHNVEEYQEIQPEGKYIILNDLDLTKFVNRKFQPDFNGEIDFNGHNIYTTFETHLQTMFNNIGNKGIIKNIVLNLKLPKKAIIPYTRGCLFENNYGTIKNIQFNLIESYNKPNRNVPLLGGRNFGTIDNFIFNLQEKLYGQTYLCIGVEQNYGTIKNGYVYGQGIELSSLYTDSSNSWVSGITVKNYGTIENIYSNFEITKMYEKKMDEYSGNLVAINYGIAKNIYSVQTGDLIKGPNVGNISGGIVNNAYYFSNKVLDKSTETFSNKLVLYESEFQRQVLNSQNSFDIATTVEKGYFPHIIMPDSMPAQPYITLPEVQDKDLVDILATKVIENNNDNVKVEFAINNLAGEDIQNIKIKNVDTKIVSQTYDKGKTKVIAILSNPILYVSNYSVLSITSKGAYNIAYTRNFEDGERNIQVDLYKTIYTVDDWKQINKSPTENYKLMNNLDFKNEGNSVSITNNFRGKLDGNNYEIRNYNSDSPLLYRILNATVKNLFVNNVTLNKLRSNTELALIGRAEVSNIDNVHIKNIKINNSANQNYTVYFGGLSGFSNGSIISNCSVSNIRIENNNEMNKVNVGAIVGHSNQSQIENTYVLNMNWTFSNIKDLKAGGIIGYENYMEGKITNCYAIGSINVETGDIGGIAGNYSGSISNTYSEVNIETMSDNVGGIVGYDRSNINNLSLISNNFAIGNLYSSKESEFIGRIAGRSVKESKNNYVYEYQKLNGKLPEGANKVIKYSNIKARNIYKEILNWGNAYDYTYCEKGRLPQLINSSNNEILHNQEERYLKNKEKFVVTNIETAKINSSKAQIRLEILTPNNIEITNIKIDNMEINIQDIQKSNNTTYINLVAETNKFYDKYKISEIKYIENNEEAIENIEVPIQLILYKEIYTFEDWQSIEDDYQNYKLMADIDFSGKQNINTGFKVGRLESEGVKHKLSNITIKNENVTNIIQDIQTEIKNIIFENITLENVSTTTKDYFGIILYNFGLIDNVEFKNIELNAPNYNMVGCIAVNRGNEISNIKLRKIKINAREKVGALVGRMDLRALKNIDGNEIEIIGSNNYIGGFFGNVDNDNGNADRMIENITASNVNVKGKEHVGGIIGAYAGAKNITATNINVEGNNYVGGIIGYSSYMVNSKNNIIKNSTIKGHGLYIGGIAGQYGGGSFNKVENCNIEGTSNSKNIGGAYGNTNNGIERNAVIDTNINVDGEITGGITGTMHSTNLTYSYTKNVNIIGTSRIGGIAGEEGESSSIYVTYTNSNINGSKNSVGGLIGYLNNKNSSESNSNNFYYNAVYDTKLQAKSNVGGLIGEVNKELYIGMNSKIHSNFIHTDIVSEDINTASLGIGNRENQNQYLENAYYYKYSSINGKNPNKQNEIFIRENQYLEENDLKKKETYTEKLKWSGGNWNFEVLTNNKYPVLKDFNLPNQEGIDIPKDAEHIIDNFRNEVYIKETENDKFEEKEILENIFTYEGKTIKTYETYSEIIAEDGSKVIREDVRLYVKNGKLYALPVMLNVNDSDVKLVANNFIIDSYNGKEYETVLGSDGKMYDLKESINYPENFVNKEIVSIGNNLDSEDFIENLTGNNMNTVDPSKNENEKTYELEITYKNGDKLRFNYQTGEIIFNNKNEKVGELESDSADTNLNKDSKLKSEDSRGLLEYVKERFSEIGNADNKDIANIEMQNKYKESIKIQNKLEETPVEEAVQLQNSNVNKLESSTATDNKENNETNNSLKEKKYISIYNAEKDDYQIYQEEELLDTSKQEVISENQKIETNNLNKYYSSEVEAKNTKMGIVWIALSIIGVLIILIGIWGRT